VEIMKIDSIFGINPTSGGSPPSDKNRVIVESFRFNGSVRNDWF
jgi:hypothetical protein